MESTFFSYTIELMRDNYTFEQIKYLLKKKQNMEISVSQLEKFAEENKEAILLEKELKLKKESSDLNELIFKLNVAIDAAIELMKNSDDKVSVRAIRELNNSIMNIAKLTGKLEEMANANVSNFYIEITKIDEYLLENINNIIKLLSPEKQSKLLARIRNEQ